jgi:hypothetical protein
MLISKLSENKIRVRENSFFAAIAAKKLGSGRVALTLGNTIHLHNTDMPTFLQDSRWVLHELKHVEQFRRYGFLPFLALYLWESLRKGYYNNKFEAEARAAEEG